MKEYIDSDYLYKIVLAYEIPYNVLDSQEPSNIQARENLYKILQEMVPEDKYEKFSIKLILHQFKDTFNYMVTYEAYFRSTSGLPMEEYVEANKIKEKAKQEIENFFSALDCEYKQLNIKTLL